MHLVRPSVILSKSPVTTIISCRELVISAFAADFDDANARSINEMPSVTRLPLIGSSWTYLPFVGKYDAHRELEAAMSKYQQLGPIYRDDFGSVKTVCLHNPEDIEQMYRHEGKFPSRGHIDS